MYQISTIDSEFNLFPTQELDFESRAFLNTEDEKFYSSIKEKLNKLAVEPPKDVVDNIINYSKSL